MFYAMDNGFIILSRGIIDSDVFASQKLLKIWVWCLCRASFKDRTIPISVGKGESIVNIKRGQFIFGRHKAEDELFIDGSTIYKAMKKLQEIGNITIKSNNQYSIVTICNYDKYQDVSNYKVTAKEQPSNNQVTANEQPSNTNNKDNKDKKVNKDKEDYIDKIVNVFSKVYNENFGLEYIVTNKGKERSAAGKITAIYKSKYPDATSEETLKALEVYFDACCKIDDDFYRTKLSLSLIINQFNQINNQLKNGRKKNIRTVAERSAEIDAIVDAVYDSKK